MTDAAFENRLLARCDGPGGPSLAEWCSRLLEDQKRAWPELAAGHDALAKVRLRDIPCSGFSVRVQFNPKRMTSSAAKVDPESIRKRRCFLCPRHLPRSQRGILYRRDYLILCNPAPIFPRHYTISSLRHIPQLLEDHLEILLLLAEDFSGEATVLYNGPRSGASAPDHFHFQAFPAGALPLESAWEEKGRKRKIMNAGSVSLSRGTNLGRAVLVAEGRDALSVGRLLRTVIDGMKKISGEPGEPMMNILCTHGERGWRIVIFPRRSHRPGLYYREGDGRVLISPGAVDMGGLIITAREKDFMALDPGMVQDIFREVSWTEEKTDALERVLSGKPLRIAGGGQPSGAAWRR